MTSSQEALLPDALRERLRPLVAGAPSARGQLVLYWMRMAVRDHDNPALDAAVVAANALGLPLLVYHAVSERYPYASDRHHTFILEGAHDVAAGLAARGIAYALHVERPGARGPVLAALSQRAALVVTEDVPVPPIDGWTARLAGRLAAAGVPLWLVDASCIVPMPLLGKRYERAFAFRSASRGLAAGRLAAGWHDVAPQCAALAHRDLNLPFSPVDPATLDDRGIAAMVAACEIDHGVGPVRDRRGGSRAGYARWAWFREHGLADYARERNDPLRDGTSRLSPYLHYGYVSPLRIAREAALVPGDGAEKFLDELLVWREVAWHYAAHTPPGALETLDALPAWARQSLMAHAGDARGLRSREALWRARTGDALWDACQRSLLAHGELHNNLRMTWGKAVPAWTADPEAARAMLVDLNNRYALDGRDPASYGGLYWCLGLFDRPFAPEAPVLGVVRARPTADHARRLDVAAYAAQVGRPGHTLGRVAVVGAGLAGLLCARTLADHNLTVTVFDKGRSAGGRLAARRIGSEGHGRAATFDLGAQYFTVRDERFARWVRTWREQGLCAPWPGRLVALDPQDGSLLRQVEPLERLVGTPDMNVLARHLAADLMVRPGHRIDRIVRAGCALRLFGTVALPGTTLGPAPARAAGEELLGEFDWVLLCLPAEQSALLAAEVSAGLSAKARACPLSPCLALGVADEALRGVPFDGAFIGREDTAGPLSWVARDSSKPGRVPGERWVLHAGAAFSAAHFDASREQIADSMLAELGRLLGLAALRPTGTALQRWRYARAPQPLTDAALVDAVARLGLGGDWVAGGRVEGAFLSGVALAGRVLGLA